MTEETKEGEGFRVTDRRGGAKETPSAKEPDFSPKEEAKAPPPMDFTTFVLSLSTSALVHLGMIEDPHTKKEAKNLELARQEIDIIEMLSEKTKGNLSSSEKRLMEEVLYQLRLNFVEQSKAK